MSLDTRGILQSIAPSHLAAETISISALVKALGMWLEYVPKENRFRELDNDELKGMIWSALDGRSYIHRGKGGDEEKQLYMNTKRSADIREAMIHLALERGIEKLPFWRHKCDDDPDPRYLLSVSNGLLDWRTGELIEATPRFVSTDCSDIGFDPNAVTFMWDMFLDEIFDGDHEQVELLHEVMGCILTGQHRFQKIFQLFGPPRSGKGTINLMLTRLLGMRSVASPRIKQIAEGGFGLQSLIGKKAAIVGDARLERGRKTSALTELLLSTSGGDLQTVQRKFKDDFVGYLPVQWMLMSNEPILMHDLTGTIATRMVLLETRRSFLGREDNTLFERDLLPEAAGVLNRCLEAARRLSKRGRFLVPSSIKGRQAEILREASTVTAFASECLIADSTGSTPKQDIYDAYERYCRGHGRIRADVNIFWRDLRTSGKFRDDMVKRVRIDGRRVQTVEGLQVHLDENALPFATEDDFPK
ncbi:phage/plasmid primase, P4 family [Roseovarius sp. EL26]|uniref:DNA primase family protein n=1 Tax=Roseovarius sp. EL26 TaxID=2126672 RepID=UPI000EA00157|nr:DNA primase family protein [Roseovarius sp. EL26]